MCVRVGFGLPALSSPAAGLFIPDTGHDFSPKRARRESLAYSAGARVGRLEVAIAPHSILLLCSSTFFFLFSRGIIFDEEAIFLACSGLPKLLGVGN